MLPPIFVFLVYSTLSLVDSIRNRSHVLHPVVPLELTAMEVEGTFRNGHHLLCFVCDQQDREPLHLQSIRYRFCYRSVYRGSTREYLFEEDGWHGIYLYGHGCPVLGPSECSVSQIVLRVLLESTFSVFSPASPKREVSQRTGRRSTLEVQ